MKSCDLKKRQYKYKVGSVVEFTDRIGEWIRNQGVKSGDLGIVDKIDGYYYISVKHIKSDKVYYLGKSYEVRLVNKETAIMEQL